jgi:hypothetical protein
VAGRPLWKSGVTAALSELNAGRCFAGKAALSRRAPRRFAFSEGAGGDHGKTKRMEGVEGMWLTGQLVVGLALGSQSWLKAAVEAI